MNIMKKMQLTVIMVLIGSSMVVESRAQDRGIDGLVLGAGGGALVGQAIGRDAKATLLGTAVGGMVGYMVGNEMDKGNYDNGYAVTRAGVFFPPPPPLPPVVFSFNDRDHHRDGYRPHHRRHQVCWDEVVRVERRHGRYREEVRTVCRDKGWRGRDRDGWRDDHRDRDRW